jgi:soluble lytic murein transglycosylase
MRRRRGCLPSFVLFVVFVAVAFALLYKPVMKRLYPIEYRDQIWEYSQKYGLDPYLVCGVIHTESRFRPAAESRLGAVGLMQIMPETGLWIGDHLGLALEESELTDPDTNILLGCWYLRYLLDQFEQDYHLALAAYNGGIGNVRKWLADPDLSRDGERLDHIPFAETAEYVGKVEKAWAKYRELYGDEYE